MKYIFEIIIKPGHTLEEYVKAWKRGSKIIQKLPGAKGTKLYRKIDEPNKLLAIAEWKSKDIRDIAMSELDKKDVETKKIISEHRKYGKIRHIGEYGEADWLVTD